jgi:hypothetical protein
MWVMVQQPEELLWTLVALLHLQVLPAMLPQMQTAQETLVLQATDGLMVGLTMCMVLSQVL